MSCTTNNTSKTCNSCCSGLVPKNFDQCEANTVVAYVDRIFDGKLGHGSAIVEAITTTSIPYITNAEFTPCNSTSCGSSNCVVGIGAQFTVECVESKLEAISFSTNPATSLFINGTIAASMVANPIDGGYIATVSSNNNIPSPLCECNGSGSKSSVILSNATGWTYVAKHVLTGNVTYQGQTCRFCVTIQDSPLNGGHALDPLLSSTLLIPQICIPDVKSSIYLGFNGTINLLNPTLSVVAVNPLNISDGTFVQLQSNVILTPRIIGEVIQKTRVFMRVGL